MLRPGQGLSPGVQCLLRTLGQPWRNKVRQMITVQGGPAPKAFFSRQCLEGFQEPFTFPGIGFHV